MGPQPPNQLESNLNLNLNQSPASTPRFGQADADQQTNCQGTVLRVIAAAQSRIKPFEENQFNSKIPPAQSESLWTKSVGPRRDLTISKDWRNARS
jgi:hypothetical protein